MDLGLKGKRALVMGGSKGLGRSIADAIAAERRLGKFLAGLNALENLWRRIEADDFIAAHRQRIAAAYARKDEAWRMLVKAKEQEAAIYAIHAKERLDDLRFLWESERRQWEL